MKTHPNAMKTHCKRGHPYSEENTYVTLVGRRQCKACRAFLAALPKPEKLQRRIDRARAKAEAKKAANMTREERDRAFRQTLLARANAKAITAVAEAKKLAESLVPVRLCKRGHPLDPTYRGCKECSKQFLRSVRKFTSKNLGTKRPTP